MIRDKIYVVSIYFLPRFFVILLFFCDCFFTRLDLGLRFFFPLADSGKGRLSWVFVCWFIIGCIVYSLIIFYYSGLVLRINVYL
jgi:hypothetical protein